MVSCCGRFVGGVTFPVCTLGAAGFDLDGNICQALPRLEAGTRGAGDGAASEPEPCTCCIFFRSFCEILKDLAGRCSGLEAAESPRDKLDVREDEACSMISFMPSLLDGRGEAPQGFTGSLGSFSDDSRKASLSRDPWPVVGVFWTPSRPCRLRSLFLSGVVRSSGTSCNFDTAVFEGVVGSNWSSSSSSSISKIRSFNDRFPFSSGAVTGLGEPGWISFDDLRRALC